MTDPEGLHPVNTPEMNIPVEEGSLREALDPKDGSRRVFDGERLVQLDATYRRSIDAGHERVTSIHTEVIYTGKRVEVPADILSPDMAPYPHIEHQLDQESIMAVEDVPDRGTRPRLERGQPIQSEAVYAQRTREHPFSTERVHLNGGGVNLAVAGHLLTVGHTRHPALRLGLPIPKGEPAVSLTHGQITITDPEQLASLGAQMEEAARQAEKDPQDTGPNINRWDGGLSLEPAMGFGTFPLEINGRQINAMVGKLSLDQGRKCTVHFGWEGGPPNIN